MRGKINYLILSYLILSEYSILLFLFCLMKTTQAYRCPKVRFNWLHPLSTYIYNLHSVCPFVGIGTPPTPLPEASVPSPPDQRVGGGGHQGTYMFLGGHTRLQFRGGGVPNSDDWRQSLALCLRCGFTTLYCRARTLVLSIGRKQGVY